MLTTVLPVCFWQPKLRPIHCDLAACYVAACLNIYFLKFCLWECTLLLNWILRRGLVRKRLSLQLNWAARWCAVMPMAAGTLVILKTWIFMTYLWNWCFEFMRQTESNFWLPGLRRRRCIGTALVVRGVSVGDWVGLEVNRALGKQVALVLGPVVVGVRTAPPKDGRARSQTPPSDHRAHEHGYSL